MESCSLFNLDFSVTSVHLSFVLIYLMQYIPGFSLGAPMNKRFHVPLSNLLIHAGCNIFQINSYLFFCTS